MENTNACQLHGGSGNSTQRLRASDTLHERLGIRYIFKYTQLTYLDMRLFVTSLLAEEPWKYDSKVIPLPWRQSEEDAIKSKISSGGLTLAYYSSNGSVRILQILRVHNLKTIGPPTPTHPSWR